jgi:hypothetical protein
VHAGQVGERHAEAVGVPVLALESDRAPAVLGRRRGVSGLGRDRRQVRERDRQPDLVPGLLEDRDALRVELRGAFEVALGDGDAAELCDAPRDLVEVVELTVERQRPLEQSLCLLERSEAD